MKYRSELQNIIVAQNACYEAETYISEPHEMEYIGFFDRI